MKITIGIPTRDRPFALSRLLASLHAQTFQDWDLMIVNDSAGPFVDEPGSMILESIALDHDVDIVNGARINQAYSHNTVLWSESAHELILRVDDDIILSPTYLERLYHAFCELRSDYPRIAAVSGTIFTDHIFPRDENPPILSKLRGSVDVGSAGDLLNAFTFMQQYIDEVYIETEHLYSSCLYLRDAMRQVGGWPMVYSRGVSYHEETDGTYRMHINGGNLFLVTGAFAYHSHEGVGGTRLMTPAEHGRRRQGDWERFQLRLPLMRGIPRWKPRVAVCSQHCEGIGGGQKLTYSLVQALYFSTMVECVHLYPLNDEKIESSEFILENYSFVVPKECLDFIEYGEYDVGISIGHLPPKMGELPPRRKHVHYSLYPQPVSTMPKGVDRFVAISEFSADGVRERYRRNSSVIYPYEQLMFELMPGSIEKTNSILIVGRPDGSKRTLDLVYTFLEMDDLPDGTELNIVLPSPDSGMDYHSLLSLSSEKDNINLHIGLSSGELTQMYNRSAVLWAARGMGISKSTSPELDFEHFGYTVIEALASYCLPITYDAGGYKETSIVRWSNGEELKQITSAVLRDRDLWQRLLTENLDICSRFTVDRFTLEWERVILSSNGETWASEIEWRMPDPIEKRIETSPDVHVALVGDHPDRESGFGVVMNQVAEGLAEAGFKVHVFGIGHSTPDMRGKYASLWPHPRDVDVKHSYPGFLNSRDYDAFVVIYDPFVGNKLINGIKANQRHKYTPIVSFISQEGYPAHEDWEKILPKSRACITFSQAAKFVIEERFGKEHGVDWVYLGADHARFRRYDEDTRSALRGMIEVDDKFVIMTVATNKRIKGLWRQMQTLHALRHNYFYDDAILMLHSDVKPAEQFHGIHLEMYANMLGLNNRASGEMSVLFSPSSVDVEYESDTEEMFKRVPPRNDRERYEFFTSLSMIDRYNIADLYVDMSAAEGFGIPLFEAMACGVPCITVNDLFVRREIIGDHPSLLHTSDLDVFPTGTVLRLASPAECANRIDAFRNGDNDAVIWGRDAERILEKLKWENVKKKIVDAVNRCVR